MNRARAAGAAQRGASAAQELLVPLHPRSILIVLIAWLVLVPACASDHGDGHADSGSFPSVDAGGGPLFDTSDPPRDGGGAPDLDVGSDSSFSTRSDASLPHDEPAVPPDARPSDDPSSSGWIDPPVIAPGDPCCTTSTRADLATADEDQMDQGPPMLAWDGTEWIAVWQGPHGPVLRHLDRNAQPTSARRVIDDTAFSSAIAWGNHELALSGGYQPTADDSRLAIRFLDRDGAAHGAQSIRPFLWTTSLTRHEAIHGWVSLARYYHSGDLEHRWLVTIPDGQPLAELDLGRIDGWRADRAIVVSVASRLVTVEPSQSVTTLRAYANAALAPSTPLQLDLGSNSSATRLRDTVVLVAQPESATTQSVVFDPFTNAVVGTPVALPDIGGDFELAGDDVGGTVGVCYVGETTVRFGLLGPDGSQLGSTIELGHGYPRYTNCAVATSAQDEYVVVWYGASVLLGNLHATTVHVSR